MRHVLLAGILLFSARTLAAQSPDSLRIYAALVEHNPGDSRAVYRLASLKPRGSSESIDLLERYTAMEPDDAWGHLALAEAHAAAHQFDAALRALARAEALAPTEEDVDIVKARIRRAQRAAAPALQPRLSLTRDSDANELIQLSFSADATTGSRSRWGAMVTHSSSDDGFAAFATEEVRASFQSRTPTTRLELSAGAARAHATTEFTTAIARGRVRWSPGPASALIDVRAARAPLLVSPLLVANRVVLTEVRGTAELPVSRIIRVRGIGQIGDLSAGIIDTASIPNGQGRGNGAPHSGFAVTTSHNSRIGVGGAIVMRTTPVTEFAVTYYQLSYDAPASNGYFAPRLVQVADVGTYAEVYRLDPVTIAVDLGAGIQRIAQHGGESGEWSVAARGWTQVTVPFSRALELDVELEAYRSQLNNLATSPSWSSLSAALSLRWLLGL